VSAPTTGVRTSHRLHSRFVKPALGPIIEGEMGMARREPPGSARGGQASNIIHFPYPTAATPPHAGQPWPRLAFAGQAGPGDRDAQSLTTRACGYCQAALPLPSIRSNPTTVGGTGLGFATAHPPSISPRAASSSAQPGRPGHPVEPGPALPQPDMCAPPPHPCASPRRGDFYVNLA